MKKSLILGVMILLTAAATIGFAASPVSAEAAKPVLSTNGTIRSVDHERAVIAGTGDYAEIDIAIDEKTHLVNAADGKSVQLADLKPGMKVTAYYSERVTRSIPPQSHGFAVIVEPSEAGPFYLRAAQVEAKEHGDLRILDSNGDRLVTVRRADFADTEKIREGSELLTWYRIMTLSIPGQATAIKTVLLSEGPDLIVHQEAKSVNVRGSVIANAVVAKDGTVYLPVRAVAEKLGYSLEWDANAQSVLFIQSPQTAALTIGSRDYSRLKMRIQLEQAPVLIDGKTFAPIEFFAQALAADISVEK